jgi:hypothetical protein
MQESYSVPEIILEEAEEATLQLLPARSIMKKYFLNLMSGEKNGR